MCGIFGIISKDEKKYTEITAKVKDYKKQKILENLTPRGPDSNGEYYGEKCYFLSSRLRICDNDNSSNQPFDTDGIVIVFNGEIYNHAELRDELIANDKNIHFQTKSDTEVIIKLYDKEGASFIDKLIGIFAFCLYDTRRKEVFLYRDRFGVKPLFYYETDGYLIFSSDIPSILECIDNQPDVLPTSISSYLSFRNVVGQNTFFNNIKKIEPGHYIMVHRAVASTHDYWSLDPSKIDTVPDLYEASNNLQKILVNAVQRNIPQTDVLNIFLSGGLDSSSIVYFANNLIKEGIVQPKKIKTYSIGFDTANEFDYALIVADKFQTEHTNIITNTDEYVENMIDLIQFKGEPLNVPNEPLINIMSKHVKSSGDIILSGEGADEILYGYGRLFISYYNYLNDTSVPFSEYFLDKYSYISEEYKKSILSPKVWETKMKYDIEIKNIFHKTFDECTRSDFHYQDRIGYAMLKLHLPCLLARLDNASMMASVEGRVPFLDHDVVEYCFYRIPREFKIKLLKEVSISELMEKSPIDISEKLDSPKHILKVMLQHELPVDVIKRKKVGFSVPIERILMEKFEVIIKMLESGYLNKMNLFNLTELTERFKKQTLQQYDNFTLWLLLNLEMFAQLFIYKIPISDVKTFFLVDPQYKYEKTKLIERIFISYDTQVQRYIKLYIIKSLFEKYNIEYFAYGGTMLGCVRHQGFIPWDDDIDLMIMEDQQIKITNELRMELLYAGFQIKKSTEGYKIFDYENNSFFVDIFVAQYTNMEKTEINYNSHYFLENFPGRFITTEELYPLTKYKFGFFELNGIKEPENYFSRCNYGDYLRCAIVSQLHDKTNNDLLQAFLKKYGLTNLLIRDASMLSYKYELAYTDDWKQYFNRMKELIPSDFNPYSYLMLNGDLKQGTYDDIDLYIHYIMHGRFENRVYNMDTVLPGDFDVKGYRCLNPDLSDKTDQQLRAHYITIGKNMKRKYNIRSLLPYDFDADKYKYLNPDIANLSEEKLIYHYIYSGKAEKRYYTTDGIVPDDFNYERYIKLNPDLKISNKQEAVIHYVFHGHKENRRYK